MLPTLFACTSSCETARTNTKRTTWQSQSGSRDFRIKRTVELPVAFSSTNNCKMTDILIQLSCVLFLVSVIPTSTSLKRDDCEVCFNILETFPKALTDSELKDPKLIETKFREYCKNIKGKENRFCYYIGGLEESATGILGEMSKPLSWGMPPDKICEKLKKLDAQICDLRYEKSIDLNTVDLKKLKVRDLRKILSGWDEECDGCLEKGDFIKRIEALKPKYVRTEL